MGADAKIDLEKASSPGRTRETACSFVVIQNVIHINRQPLPVYQSVIEKTRGLAFRTQALGAAVTRTYGQPAEAEVAA